MATSVVLVAAATLLFLLYSRFLHPILFSPLSQIPTPHWSCAISNIWILRVRKLNAENKLLHDAHGRFGSVVRVGPKTISVDGAGALRTIYLGGFEKASWYTVFDNYGLPSMFSTLGSREHSLKKRMISNVYSKSYIQSSETAKSQCGVILFERLLPIIKRSALTDGAPGIEVQSLFMATAMDLISAYVFGLGNSTNFLEDESFRDRWLRLYLSRHSHHFWSQELPFLTSICKKLKFRLYPSDVDDANAELATWTNKLCEKTEAAIWEENNGPVNLADQPIVLKALRAGIDKENKMHGENSLVYSTTLSHPELSAACEIHDHLLAGHETAGIALTYLSWHLSQSQEAQDKLKEELDTLSPSMSIDNHSITHQLPDPKVLDSLPILNAMVMETLRLHAPIPGPQPRQTPYPSCNIEGYEIPGGVRIAALAYTLHRDEEVFPKPNEWNYTRWLKESTTEEHRKEMNRHFWAFGSGGRMCLGSNFALNELKFVVGAIYANFKSFVVDDDGIEQTGGYTARPASEKLVLRFEALDMK